MRMRISHPFKAGAPGWPGNEIFEVAKVRSTERGDINNSCIVRFHEHYGTHFDAPFHFNGEGPSISQLPFDYFFYQRPLLLDIPKEDHQRYEPEDFQPFEDRLASCDFLMLRSGFERYREVDPERYQMRTPSLSPACAAYLVEKFAGTLKTIALDFISLGSPSDTSGDPRLTHCNLLGCGGAGFICAIEDAHLADVPADATLKAAASIPLLMDEVDSGPVTCWVELD